MIAEISEIEELRKKSRIPKSELCSAANIHAETYRRWLKKFSSPTTKNLVKLKQALDGLLSSEIEEADSQDVSKTPISAPP